MGATQSAFEGKAAAVVAPGIGAARASQENKR
jgi:hypothetical protein